MASTSNLAFITGLLSGATKRGQADQSQENINRQFENSDAARRQAQKAQDAQLYMQLMNYIGKTGEAGMPMAQQYAGKLGINLPSNAAEGIVTYGDRMKQQSDAANERARQAAYFDWLAAKEKSQTSAGNFDRKQSEIERHNKAMEGKTAKEKKSEIPSLLKSKMGEMNRLKSMTSDPDKQAAIMETIVDQTINLAKSAYGVDLDRAGVYRLFGVPYNGVSGTAGADGYMGGSIGAPDTTGNSLDNYMK